MNIPNWLKPGIYGAAVGAVVVAIGGFTWGGWVTGSKAEAMASNRAQAEVVAAMVPFCVALSKADPEMSTKLAKLNEAGRYGRAEILMEKNSLLLEVGCQSLTVLRRCKCHWRTNGD